MGLYLCIFDENEELEGVDVGAYSDFGFFRNAITTQLEEGHSGARYPTLMLHSDCDGEWSPNECQKLEAEIEAMAAALKELPSVEFNAQWQRKLADSLGLQPANMYESFIDVDGEPLLERLLTLCKLAQNRGKPILFQ